MCRRLIALLGLLFFAQRVAAEAPTRVIVLGVEHAAQLVAKGDQPGALAAFATALAPDAICIERAPEQFARGDHYEFTYEIQGILLPLAAETGVDICPFDWMPPVEDQKLALGLDLETPPEIRPQSGFRGFLSFPDPAILKRDLFDADRAETTGQTRRWAGTAAPRADRDFPRRLYLYRTFMQARRIRAAAARHPGGTVLVVVGQFHKPDIEAILRDDPAIALVQPSSLPRPSPDEVARATSQAHRAAILSFNLLGVQGEGGTVDWPWVGAVLDAFEAGSPGPEARLYRIRYRQLTKAAALAEAIAAYRALARDPGASVMPVWNGAKDPARIDSYFDPFGNLSIAQRAGVELARCLAANGKRRDAADELARVRADLPDGKARQLDGYASRLW
ncbi:hypothetical protein [Sphingomonas colocasiae]|uniref:Haem-binding uptake Tiki superfamily ChaN domain-containing protein n=1 Tax=Sphingomonas colocasiae TaxID=1848973 RepID=A0ABS7PNB6_9SPHN|nr:hypothetical protein [Sphingomonas colocasiae]MBY8821534.1 hypothetical protein [Sphingomonas colocasiae]